MGGYNDDPSTVTPELASPYWLRRYQDGTTTLLFRTPGSLLELQEFSSDGGGNEAEAGDRRSRYEPMFAIISTASGNNWGLGYFPDLQTGVAISDRTGTVYHLTGEISPVVIDEEWSIPDDTAPDGVVETSPVTCLELWYPADQGRDIIDIDLQIDAGLDAERVDGRSPFPGLAEQLRVEALRLSY